MVKKLLTTKELAEELNISIPTLYRWMENKSIPYIKVNHTLRFQRHRIDQWLENNTKKSKKKKTIDIEDLL